VITLRGVYSFKTLLVCDASPKHLWKIGNVILVIVISCIVLSDLEGPDKMITLSDDYSFKTLLVGNVGPKRRWQIGDSDVDGGTDVRLGRRAGFVALRPVDVKYLIVSI
jgi:hypothetical protein